MSTYSRPSTVRRIGLPPVKVVSVARVTALWFTAAVVVLAPLSLLLVNASKPTGEATSVSASLPSRFALFDNIATVIQEGNTITGFVNSVLITVPSIALILFFGSMAAWVFARGRTRTVGAVYFVAISGILLPPAIVATLRVMSSLGLSGRPALILFYLGTQLSLAVFVMTGFVKSIPIEIEEAARVDGASTLRVYWSIVLPSLRPVLLTTAVISALLIWNDFLTPFFLLSDPSQQTMPLGLYNFASATQYTLNWNLIFTQVLLVSLPLLVLFVIAQRRIVGGLLGGALK
ncbi:carbohydrate ABC transporter permease [Leifsonia sp. AG29]|uniref:carbohydrate ABC transporter permease n=1 Tax=Leifsonia sp. AG29 TaxID=2598860 RepID=UPI00131E7CC1|nr:carbohydrate ABC transporter permease [Leifsonia sp. AG29]